MLPDRKSAVKGKTVALGAGFMFTKKNVTLAGATVPSVRSELVNPIVTFAVGCLFRTTVTVVHPPPAIGVCPEAGVPVFPAASLSVFVTDTSLAFRLL